MLAGMLTVKALLEEQQQTIAMFHEAQAKMNIVKASLSQSTINTKAQRIQDRKRFEEKMAPINDKIKVHKVKVAWARVCACARGLVTPPS